MSTVKILTPVQREPELLGQTVVVIGGSAGIGLETARRARMEGAKVILTAQNPDRLKKAASEIDALNTAAFDAGCVVFRVGRPAIQRINPYRRIPQR